MEKLYGRREQGKLNSRPTPSKKRLSFFWDLHFEGLGFGPLLLYSLIPSHEASRNSKFTRQLQPAASTLTLARRAIFAPTHTISILVNVLVTRLAKSPIYGPYLMGNHLLSLQIENPLLDLPKLRMSHVHQQRILCLDTT